MSDVASRLLHVLLPTIGSAGDVHPVIGLGVALRTRGHRATIITNPIFQELIEAQGLGFIALGTAEDARRTMANPDLWHPRKGFSVVAREAMIPSVEPVYRAIERHADERTVVAASGISFGARVAQERLGVPLATVHLQPGIIRSLVDQGMAGNIRISARQPMWFKRAFFWLADRSMIDRELKGPINAFRATLGLRPIDRVMHHWMHSTSLVIGFFPDWFGEPQPDWPPNTHLVGFPLWDTGAARSWPPGAEEFLQEGDPPIVVTPGSAAATLHQFFEETVKALRARKERAMLVTNFPAGPEKRPAQRGGLRLPPVQRAPAPRRDARVPRRHRHARPSHARRHPADRRPQRTRSVRQRLAHRAPGHRPKHPADEVPRGHGDGGHRRAPRRSVGPREMPRLRREGGAGRRRDARVRAHRTARWPRCCSRRRW